MTTTGFQLILPSTPSTTFLGPDTIQLHCTGHEPPLLLGNWPAPWDEETDGAYQEGVAAAVEAHTCQHHPKPDPADTVPRRRNPHLWCEQHANGTWIHGDPHNCPVWARR